MTGRFLTMCWNNGNNCLWIILILILFCGWGGNCGNGCGNSCGCGNNNCGCDCGC